MKLKLLNFLLIQFFIALSIGIVVLCAYMCNIHLSTQEFYTAVILVIVGFTGSIITGKLYIEEENRN
jgi:hypothetical protein